jgi:hypothetical protein
MNGGWRGGYFDSLANHRGRRLELRLITWPDVRHTTGMNADIPAFCAHSDNQRQREGELLFTTHWTPSFMSSRTLLHLAMFSLG